MLSTKKSAGIRNNMDSKHLKIIYMGTPDFAVLPLRTLVESGYNVAAVVTAPEIMYLLI